jgi:HSP20 family protein
MSNLIRWEPMREMVTLREAMDRLFEDAFTRPLGLGNGWHSSGAPAIDMYQTDNEVVVKAAVPGMKAEEVQISVTGDILTIKGEMSRKDETEEKNYHIREQRWGAFERSVMLPTTVVSDKARAEFENGILTVTLPKAEEVKPKMITVKAK